MSLKRTVVLAVLGTIMCGHLAWSQGSFVNFETPHVHPIDLSPDGSILAVCNTPDNRIELYDVESGVPNSIGAVQVGLDPVSVRFRTASELWVANQISDSVSVVDLGTQSVIATLTATNSLATDLYYDEPCDIVFAGDPQRAFVTFSQSNVVAVYDPANLNTTPAIVPIDAEDPRAMAVSPDGSKVYVAIFESGNDTTVLGGGSTGPDVISFPPNAVSNSAGPYNGQNPPPSGGAGFDPPLNPSLPTPPPTGLVVRKDPQGHWRDENGTDWTAFVSGPNAKTLSGRVPGWDLLDYDVAIIDANSLSVNYARHLMNICMAIAVNPVSGAVSVVGTEAHNEVRFTPKLDGKFIRVEVGFVSDGQAAGIVDLNKDHLDYSTSTIALADRMKSIGDPRGIVWSADGLHGYITGMGSNNLIEIDDSGNRVGTVPIDLPEGPTGLVMDNARNRLYVVSKFAATVSTVDLDTASVVDTRAFYDPTPAVIRKGRKHLYNTHLSSGLGQIACGSCHVDARMDRLAWDLGNPAEPMKAIDDDDTAQNLGMNAPGLNSGFQDWHPMKGPMMTMTMQNIIGQEPFHWRGDRDGLEEFNSAFPELQGADGPLTATEMQEFEDFLATIHYTPNPFRNLDNSLRDDLPVGALGQYASGRFKDQTGGLPEGAPLPDGNAQHGLDMYRSFDHPLDRGTFSCVLCHTLPTGGGSNAQLINNVFQNQPAGPDGELHHALVSVDGSSNITLKVAQLRNAYEKVGCDFSKTGSRAGYGFIHDGSVDSLPRFVSEAAFEVQSDQDVADLVALILQFSGSDFGPPSSTLEPPGTTSKDAHAAVGKQATITSSLEALNTSTPLSQHLMLFMQLAEAGRVDLVARHFDGTAVRGYALTAANKDSSVFAADSAGEDASLAQLIGLASADAPVIITVTPAGTGTRIGIDRDEDGLLDYDEVRDYDDRQPGVQNPFDPAKPDATGDNGSMEPDGILDGQNDFDGDGQSNADELAAGTSPVPVTNDDPNDVNGSGTVDSVDLQFVINAALGLSIDPTVHADVDGNATVDAVDVQLVINAILNG